MWCVINEETQAAHAQCAFEEDARVIADALNYALSSAALSYLSVCDERHRLRSLLEQTEKERDEAREMLTGAIRGAKDSADRESELRERVERLEQWSERVSRAILRLDRVGEEIPGDDGFVAGYRFKTGAFHDLLGLREQYESMRATLSPLSEKAGETAQRSCAADPDCRIAFAHEHHPDRITWATGDTDHPDYNQPMDPFHRSRQTTCPRCGAERDKPQFDIDELPFEPVCKHEFHGKATSEAGS